MSIEKTTFSYLFQSILRNRALIIESTKREISSRYKGSAIGILWSLITPIFLLIIYTFVFSTIFKARWGGGTGSQEEFALLLFAGLIIFNLFAECISRAPSLITANVNYVKKVIFPLEILPIVLLFSALYHALISLAVWMIAYCIFFGVPHYSILFAPLILLPFSLFIMGLSWWLASIGVFLRDVSQVIPPLITAMMFLSPLFYPLSALPSNYQPLLYLNPLTITIEELRNLLYWGKGPDYIMLLGYSFLSLIVAYIGFVWFQKTRKGFADVL